MNDPNVHVANHPTGQPNKTAVNPDNPIFGRPADPILEVSLQQAAIVQSEKNPRETVQSPLLHEEAASPVEPSVAELDAMQAAGEEDAAIFETKEYSDGSSATGVAPLPELSPAEQDAEGSGVQAGGEDHAHLHELDAAGYPPAEPSAKE